MQRLPCDPDTGEGCTQQPLPLCDPATDPSCDTNPYPQPSPQPSKDRYIEVYVDSLSATQVTDSNTGNNHDEVYMEVTGSTPAARYAVRMPRREVPSLFGLRDNDDYYDFQANQNSVASDVSSWVNLDRLAVGRPMIYSGPLLDGQSVSFDVTFLEQDDGNGQETSTAVKTGLSALTSIVGTNPYGLAALATAKSLADLIPTTSAGDFLGGYSVTVKNTGGVLTRTWLPYGTVSAAKGTSVTTLVNNDPYATSNTTAVKELQSFTLNGTSQGQYLATGAVEIVSQATANEDRPLVYLSQNTEACGSDNLIISGVRVGKTQTKGMNVSLDGGSHWWNRGSFYHWNCDGSDEQSKVNSDVQYVIAAHHGGIGDRDIHLSEFRKTDR